MKIAKLIKPEIFYHLILEDLNDVEVYQKIYFDITAEKNVQAYMGFVSQTYRDNFSDYLVHESVSTAPETKLLAMQLAMKETPTGMIEYCTMSDSIMIKKISSFNKYINNGDLIRINQKGGYCNITRQDLNEYNEVFIPDQKQIATFINSGKVTNIDMSITQPTIIIENSDQVHSYFYSQLSPYIDIIHVDVLNNFKLRTIGYKDLDYIKLFQRGIELGLRNICFSTTGQDFHNILKLHTLLVELIKINPTITLSLYIDTSDKKTKQLFLNTKFINVYVV